MLVGRGATAVASAVGAPVGAVGAAVSTGSALSSIAQHLLARRAAMRLHVLFLSGSRAFVGVSPLANGARWSMGIPRLRLPGAPSRSAA